MNKYYLVVFCLVGALFNQVASADDGVKSEKIIYKWEVDGKVRYGHIKPIGVKKVTKLDSEGLIVEDFTKDFDEIVEISIRPEVKSQSSVTTEAPAQANSEGDDKKTPEETAAEQQQRKADRKKKNCDIAQKNLATLDGGEVYERDSKGNMMRVTAEAIELKRANVAKDVAYFCADTASDKKN